MMHRINLNLIQDNNAQNRFGFDKNENARDNESLEQNNNNSRSNNNSARINLTQDNDAQNKLAFDIR